MDALLQQRYLKVIDGLGQIPTHSAVAQKVMTIMNHRNASANHAADLIEKDVALASRVLKLANSAYYGLPRAITSVQRAITILGFSTVKSMVLSTSTLKIFPPISQNNDFNRRVFWQHSVEVAIATKLIARISSRRIDPEMAFTVGLLHDIGKLVFDQYCSEDYAQVIQEVALGLDYWHDIEHRIMGIHHATLGSMLLERWGMSDSMVVPVAQQYTPTLDQNHKELASMLGLGNAISSMNETFPVSGEKAVPLLSEARAFLGIQMNDEELLKLFREERDKASEFFTLMED